MSYLGDFAEDATVYVPLNTFDSNDPAASVTVTDFANTDIHIHKDDGLTQRNNAAGITVSIDFDGITGNHMVVIDTSDDTVAAFWVTGSDYFVRVEGATVDAGTINAWIGHFSIENRFTNVTKVSGTSQTANDIGADTNDILADTADMQPLIEKMAYVGSRGLGVWIDDGAANTNTVLGTDGTPDNPVSTIAAATTIQGNLGSQRFYLVNDTAITLAQTYEGYEFIGMGGNNQVTLGSQDVDNSFFINVVLTGTQGGTGLMHARDCALLDLVSAEIMAHKCSLTGNNTLRAATNQIFDFCHSAVAGNATPEITFPGSGTTDLMFRHYSGGLQVNSATANDTMSFESDGQFIIDATCTSLTVSIRGNVTITDNGTTSSITQSAAFTRAEVARLINPQKNTAFSNLEFEMFDSTNHNPTTGLTVTGEVSLDGGAYVAVSGSIAEVGNGTYQFDAAAGDMNGDFITFRFTASATDDTFVHVKTAA